MIDQWNDDRTGWARFGDEIDPATGEPVMRYRLALSLDGDPITVDQNGTVGWNHIGPPKGVGLRIVWLLLNPSTADAFKPDPTVGECRKRSLAFGFGIMEVVNPFAFRSPYPSDLRKRAVGYRGDDAANNDAIIAACRGAHRVIAGWGNDGALDHRDVAVRRLLAEHSITLHHLGLTQGGYPKHPLARGKHRIPAGLQPVEWR